MVWRENLSSMMAASKADLATFDLSRRGVRQTCHTSAFCSTTVKKPILAGSRLSSQCTEVDISARKTVTRSFVGHGSFADHWSSKAGEGANMVVLADHFSSRLRSLSNNSNGKTVAL